MGCGRFYLIFKKIKIISKKFLGTTERAGEVWIFLKDFIKEILKEKELGRERGGGGGGGRVGEKKYF